MERWGLEGMRSFEQPGVARKEGARLEARSEAQGVAPAEAASNLTTAASA